MIPTRSQIETYSVHHLVEAADYWGGLAERWEDAHWQVRNQAHSLIWEGASGDALRERTTADYVLATDQAERLRGASVIARQQAGELARLHNSVLYAIEDAEDAGFEVGEDLSVTDIRASRNVGERAARQAQAQAFAADVWQRATALIDADADVADSLTATAGGVGNIQFS